MKARMRAPTRTARYGPFLVWIAYLVLAGVVMFSRGFLLTREARKERSSCTNTTTTLDAMLNDMRASPALCPPRRARVAILVVDALRYDFAAWSDLPTPPAHRNRLTNVTALLRAAPRRARLFKFVADPPTTTLQRLKGMTTGSLPTFIDAGSNFATAEIVEDNFVDQAVGGNNGGGAAVLLGDDTWAALYPNRWARSFAMPSFNTWDLDTVDAAVAAKLPGELSRPGWSLLVAHILGVDHCGHRYGPDHPEMVRKLRETDEIIGDMLRALPSDAVLFVVGDHGMTRTGDHGGETDDEVDAAMFVYSPVHDLFEPEEAQLAPATVKQVDLAPTVSSILGVPPPYSNLGAVILNALPFSQKLNIPIEEWQLALINLWANVKQVTTFIQQYSQTSDQFSAEKIEIIEKKYEILSHRVQSISNIRAFHSFATDARGFLIDVRSMCQEVWIQFDSFSMSRGLLQMLLTIFFCHMIVDGIPGDRLPGIFRSSFLKCSFIAVTAAFVFGVALYYFGHVANLELTSLFSTGTMSIIMLAVVIVQNWPLIAQHWYENSKKANWMERASRGTLGFSAFALFSNSYVVEEGAVLAFLLLSLLLVITFNSGTPKVTFPLFICAGVLVATSRHYRTCREEQGECYYKRDTMTTVHLFIGMLALGFFVSLSRIWLRSCGNLVATDTLLWRYVPSVVAVCLGGHWVASWGTGKLSSWRADTLARLIMGVLSLTVVVLIVRPLSVYVVPKRREGVPVDSRNNLIPQLFNHLKGFFNKRSENDKMLETVDKEDDVPMVYGLATVYSATYVILSICVALFVILLLGARMSPSMVLFYFSGAFMLALFSVSRYHNSTTIVELAHVGNCEVVCWVLFSLYFFYGTGHQSALSSIQWSAAFVGTGGHFTYNVIPATLVIVNMYGSHILAGLCVPLLVLAPFPLFVMWGVQKTGSRVDIERGELLLYERHPLLMSAVFNVSARYILFHSIRMCVCMLAATVHCRHLMVWKIFAPKLMFEGVGLAITVFSVLAGYFLLMRIHSRLNIFLDKVTKLS